jgi:hypothetical protein
VEDVGTVGLIGWTHCKPSIQDGSDYLGKEGSGLELKMEMSVKIESGRPWNLTVSNLSIAMEAL